MTVLLHQVAALLYVAAAVTTGAGLAWPAPRLVRAGVGWLLIAAIAHAAAFAAFHSEASPPPLTDLPAAVSLMAWIAVLFFLGLMRRSRLASLVAGIGPAAAVAAFFAALRLPHSDPTPIVGGPAWPHAHVLLASAGLSLLGVAGLAGVAFLLEDRRLKTKRMTQRAWRLPSLEALDRVNATALLAGFPLLTVGVLTGMMWVQGETGRPWSGTAHETWSAFAWAIYAALVALRFRAHPTARQAALAAVAGFAFLLFAVVGVGLLA